MSYENETKENPRVFTKERLMRWGLSLIEENNPIGYDLYEYAKTWIDETRSVEKPDDYEYPIFWHEVRTSGKLDCSFVFENFKEMRAWLDDDFQELQYRYGKLGVKYRKLDGLRIGDTCFVAGEGMDDFLITDLVKSGDYLYSFVVDNEEAESVHKCYKHLHDYQSFEEAPSGRQYFVL